MSATLRCHECNEPLDEPPNLPADQRPPCPKCGAHTRDFHVIGSVGIGFGVRATIEVGYGALNHTALLMQAVIIPGSKTNEGVLVNAVAIPWFEIIKVLSDDPTLAFRIPARKWEEIIAGAYTQAGFEEVTLTPSSGDFGRDVIAVKRGIGSIRVIDQVKAYKPGHLVTADDVRALVGVLHGDGASKGFLTTTSDFAPMLPKDPLIVPFIPSKLELVNGERLLQRLQELAQQK